MLLFSFLWLLCADAPNLPQWHTGITSAGMHYLSCTRTLDIHTKIKVIQQYIITDQSLVIMVCWVTFYISSTKYYNSYPQDINLCQVQQCIKLRKFKYKEKRKMDIPQLMWIEYSLWKAGWRLNFLKAPPSLYSLS